MSQLDDESAQAAFSAAQERWRDALAAHRMAPPDAGFASRLRALSEAARLEADACRDAHAAGFAWPPHRAADSGPPYELRPGAGRPGPDELWRRFDVAAAELSRVATGTDLLAVSDAYEQLADVAGQLAEALEERASRAPRQRGRRSA
jgi:hypothetical protein